MFDNLSESAVLGNVKGDRCDVTLLNVSSSQATHQTLGLINPQSETSEENELI